jgi:hypothetical protein
VTQVQRLARRAKAKNTLTFTNTRNEDLDVLYAATEHNEDGVDHAHAHDELTEVDREEEDGARDKDYNPEQSDDKDSEDKDSTNSNGNDKYGDDTLEIEMLDDDTNVNEQDEETP